MHHSSNGQTAGLDSNPLTSSGGDPDSTDEGGKQFRNTMGQVDAPASQSYQSPDNVAQAYA